MGNKEKLNLLPRCAVCSKPIIFSDDYKIICGERIHNDCMETPTDGDLFQFIPKDDDFWEAVDSGRIKDE